MTILLVVLNVYDIGRLIFDVFFFLSLFNLVCFSFIDFTIVTYCIEGFRKKQIRWVKR